MMRRITGLALLGGYMLASRAWRVPPAGSVTLHQRLAALPLHGLPLAAAVTVHWDTHQIPFVEAENDTDLAVVLGALHVHLRWTQMEVMRRLSQGRLAEMIGPLGVEIDHALRLANFGKAVPRIVEALPEATRSWANSFVAGINRAIELASALPPDFALLGLTREPWTIADMLTLGRLVSLDVTWFTWLGLLHGDDGTSVWRRVTQHGESIGRMGSNSLAVAASRSASDAAWIASDPHLRAAMPGPWLLAGYRSPSFHAVGLMVPGLPAIALGRNPWIAWGGTNLHAASSDLIDVADLPEHEITAHRETIRVRWGKPYTITVRETRFGPIVSDAPLLRTRRRIALRWMGHEPSDELTALLRINRARNWHDFRAAADLFGVPGQNLLYADTEGHIGKLMAVRLPERTAVPAQPILPRSNTDWSGLRTSATLPASFDPPEGFVASANERPNRAPVIVGYVFSPRSRFQRLRSLLSATSRIDLEVLRAAQLDVLVEPNLHFRDLLLHLLRTHAASSPTLIGWLAGWDGRYATDSAGALAFELLVYHLLVRLRGRAVPALYSRTWESRALARADIEAADSSAIAAALRGALPAVRRDLRRYSNWGRMHRLCLPHVIAAIPVFGRRFRFGDWPVAGSNETLLKSGHRLTNRRHFAALVATARHISDLSCPDRNWFVVLGGQDGWLGSSTMMDQVGLWQSGGYIELPLTPKVVYERFSWRTEFRA
jgi:penicillin G amidase